MPVTIDPNSIQKIPSGLTIDPSSVQKIGSGEPATPPPESMLAQVGGAIKNAGVGALKGLGSTSQGLLGMMAPRGSFLNSDPQMNTTPQGTAQKVGKGLEQAAEFAVPVGGPESKLARIGMEAARGGLVNKAQGGSFGAGAAMGGAGEGLAQGVKAVAPGLAESALNIRKTDRAYKPGGAIGKSILNETRGVRPGTVAASAQESLDKLNPQLNAAARMADIRPIQPVKGLLQAPQYEVPLSAGRTSSSTRGGLFDAGKNASPVRGVDASPRSSFMAGMPGHEGGRIIEDPGFVSGGAHPELSGRTAPPKGTLLTRDPDVAMAGGVRIPPPGREVPYAGATLTPAKSVLGRAAGLATRQNEPTTVRQLQPMMEHLTHNRVTGTPISNEVSASDLLNLKRGFGNEFIHNWNPETMHGVKGTAGRTYHELGQEFNRVVPEGRELNSRISNLIPVAKRGESAELNAPTSQRIAGRVLAHTGALTGAAMGGTAGYHSGGPLGALVGGAAGLALPEMMASPTGQMIAARTLNSGAVRPLIKGAGGLLLQAGRGKSKDQEQ